jgi:hypothetical protein
MALKGTLTGIEDNGDNVTIKFNREGQENILNLNSSKAGLTGLFENLRIGGDNPSEIELVLDDPDHDRPRVTGVVIDGQSFDI